MIDIDRRASPCLMVPACRFVLRQTQRFTVLERLEVAVARREALFAKRMDEAAATARRALAACVPAKRFPPSPVVVAALARDTLSPRRAILGVVDGALPADACARLREACLRRSGLERHDPRVRGSVHAARRTRSNRSLGPRRPRRFPAVVPQNDARVRAGAEAPDGRRGRARARPARAALRAARHLRRRRGLPRAPRQRPGARRAGRELSRVDRDPLCANQIFNPTSMCAYSNVLTRALPPCFENSLRAIESSKNEPNRLRFDRAREF